MIKFGYMNIYRDGEILRGEVIHDSMDTAIKMRSMDRQVLDTVSVHYNDGIIEEPKHPFDGKLCDNEWCRCHQ